MVVVMMVTVLIIVGMRGRWGLEMKVMVVVMMVMC